MEGHVNALYGDINDCMFDFLSCTELVFTILFNHVQHVYYVYGVPCMQVAALGQICSYNIWLYAAKVFTACFCMY